MEQLGLIFSEQKSAVDNFDTPDAPRFTGREYLVYAVGKVDVFPGDGTIDVDVRHIETDGVVASVEIFVARFGHWEKRFPRNRTAAQRWIDDRTARWRSLWVNGPTEPECMIFLYGKNQHSVLIKTHSHGEPDGHFPVNRKDAEKVLRENNYHKHSNHHSTANGFSEVWRIK